MNLQQWLTHIESIHYSEIKLGLDRISTVYKRLFPNGTPFKVITVAGTNGKGSCCAYLESIFQSNGQSVGKYTSPHIIHFNERIRVNAKEVSDDDLCRVFDLIEISRGDIALTYFEYATLAAIQLFADAKVDIAVFEVGLGGRLDAVNILDPEVSIVTSIGLDHVDWLGDDIAVISQEKAAIAREGRYCVVGQDSPPQAMKTLLSDIGAKALYINQDFTVAKSENVNGINTWSIPSYVNDLAWLSPDVSHQYSNAACAIVAAKKSSLSVTDKAIEKGIAKTSVAGRCQLVATKPYTVLDVAHNYDSIKGLKDYVASLDFSGKCYAVFSMLEDKDIQSSVEELNELIDAWHIAEIADMPRATPLAKLSSIIANASSAPLTEYTSLVAAYDSVKTLANNEDCILIFGSFHVVGELHDAILRL